MNFLELAAARYSVRSFSSKPIPADVLDAILEAGRLAPTAKNQQPQRIFVIQSPEAMEKLLAVRSVYNAPVVLLVCADTDAACDRPVVDHNLGEMDASIVATHMMLAAASLGVGSCWMCAFKPAEVSAAFDLPAHVVPCLLLPLGYPAEDGTPSPRHTDRYPLEHTVTVL